MGINLDSDGDGYGGKDFGLIMDITGAPSVLVKSPTGTPVFKFGGSDGGITASATVYYVRAQYELCSNILMVIWVHTPCHHVLYRHLHQYFRAVLQHKAFLCAFLCALLDDGASSLIISLAPLPTFSPHSTHLTPQWRKFKAQEIRNFKVALTASVSFSSLLKSIEVNEKPLSGAITSVAGLLNIEAEVALYVSKRVISV